MRLMRLSIINQPGLIIRHDGKICDRSRPGGKP
jgi:hypothetical protein